MKIVVDLETTGFRNDDEIAQMATWVLDDNLVPISFNNYYFAIKNEMPPDAYKVNGLSKSFLFEKSGGIPFSEYKEQFIEQLNGHTLIAHNAAFEKRLLNYHLGGGLKDCDWICTMKRYTPTLALQDRAGNGGYKHCNLRELISYCLKLKGMEEQQLRDMYTRTTGEVDTFHNALFDTYCTAFAFNLLG